MAANLQIGVCLLKEPVLLLYFAKSEIGDRNDVVGDYAELGASES
jgi:hypothetical protein